MSEAACIGELVVASIHQHRVSSEDFAAFRRDMALVMSPKALRDLRTGPLNSGIESHPGGRPDGGVTYSFLGFDITQDVRVDRFAFRSKETS